MSATDKWGKRKMIDTLLYCGDCLELMGNIKDKSMNMILCDLPYGTTQNSWDVLIPFDELWKQYNRIIKDGGIIILTSQGLFTAKVILSNERLFKYKMIWIKSKASGFLNANKQPLRKHEDIYVFYDKLSTYNPQFTKGEKYDKGIRKSVEKSNYGFINSAVNKGGDKR